MQDLRSEIRAAFEREQAAHPPAGGLRSHLVSAAAAQPAQAPTLQWLAVVAAVVLAALVAGALLSTRLAHNPTPAGDFGRPPAGVQLIYVRDPDHPTWLIGYDWSGKARGTVKLPTPVDPVRPQVLQQPDGSGFVVGSSPYGGNPTYLDRLGRPLADNPQPECLVRVDQQTFVWTLSTKLPDQAERQVAVIARDASIGQPGIKVAACSFQNDQAILVRAWIASAFEIWVLRLSNGEVLSHHSYTANTVANIVASSDAAFIAEMPRLEPVRGPLVTSIRRVSDWRVVAELGGTMQVRGFSGDGSLVLVTWPGSPKYFMGTLDWRSGHTMDPVPPFIWMYGPWSLSSLLIQPGGGAFAIALPGNPDYGLYRVMIVHADGSTTTIPGRYTTLW